MEENGNGLIDNFVIPEKEEKSEIIKIIGVGGAGSNAVKNMYNMDIKGVNLVVCNTDAQALENSPIQRKIQLGAMLTGGLGAGNNPERGRDSAIESMPDIDAMLDENTKMVFVTAGMGGGTGTGAAPVIAQAAKKKGILTIGIVNIPYSREGKPRIRQAIKGARNMSECVDAMLVVNTDRVLEMAGGEKTSLVDTFDLCDKVMSDAARGISQLITRHNRINVDFADVRTAMTDSGCALMGIAKAEGDKRAEVAVKQALESPLLNNNDINGAKHVLLSVTTKNERDLTTEEFTYITNYVYERAGGDDNDENTVIWGAGADETLEEGVICVVVVATGFEADCFEIGNKSQEVVHISRGESAKKTKTADDEEKSPVVVMSVSPEDEETDEIYVKLYGSGKSSAKRMSKVYSTSDLADVACLPLDKLTEEELANIEQRPAYIRRDTNCVNA